MRTVDVKAIDMKERKNQFSIAIVTSRFNEEITQALHDGAIARLQELNFPADRITSVWVPGAVEIPLTVKKLAATNGFAAVICLGAVIRGETKHFDLVCEQVSYGCQRVALEHEIPVIFEVLATDTEEQALARASSRCNKGRDAVDVAMHMVSVLQQIG